jgi:hypothetical protein
LNVLGCGGGDEENDVEEYGHDVDWFPAVELWLLGCVRCFKELGEHTSDKGLTNIGPIPSPTTKRVNPRVATS